MKGRDVARTHHLLMSLKESRPFSCAIPLPARSLHLVLFNSHRFQLPLGVVPLRAHNFRSENLLGSDKAFSHKCVPQVKANTHTHTETQPISLYSILSSPRPSLSWRSTRTRGPLPLKSESKDEPYLRKSPVSNPEFLSCSWQSAMLKISASSRINACKVPKLLRLQVVLALWSFAVLPVSEVSWMHFAQAGRNFCLILTTPEFHARCCLLPFPSPIRMASASNGRAWSQVPTDGRVAQSFSD